MEKKNVIAVETSSTELLLWGSIILMLGLALGLGAYYLHIEALRYIAFFLILSGITVLFTGITQDLKKLTNSTLFSWILVLFLLVVYFSLRTALHRFDFSVGDASDYYWAGLCSVTYAQDIGFFLPLTASVSAIGYTVFGVEYTPLINVILYSASLPVSYFLFRKLGLTTALSFIITLFLIFAPSSIWFSRTSFTEPIWQLTLLMFALFAYKISSDAHLKLKDILALSLLMLLIPFLRGEAALYYGLVIFLSLYHLWKFQNLRSAMIITSTLILLALSIHVTLGIRAHYLLGWQFSRIIPNITEIQLMSILYGVSFVAMALIFILSKFQKGFSRINLPIVLTLFAILIKVVIAYLFSIKKNMLFTDMLFMNEYGLALGNFGLPITLLMAMGILLLYIKAIQGDRASLTLIIIYTIFYLPFVMQAVTFQDPHEVFFYWNRYYLSIFMMIHIFALSLVAKLTYEQLGRLISPVLYRFLLLLTLLLGMVYFSMSGRLHHIVTHEAYLENSYKLFSWVTQRVGQKNLSVVYDSEIKYPRHNGQYDAKVFIARGFTVVKVRATGYQKVTLDKLNSALNYVPDISKSDYLLSLSTQKCNLENKQLTLVDTIILPISWREHYRAHPIMKKELHGDVTKSLKNNLKLHLSLYEIGNRFNFNSKIIFKKSSKVASSFLKKGWMGIVGGTGALSSGSTATLSIPGIQKENDTMYTVKLKYSILSASKLNPQKVQFSINGKMVEEIEINSPSIKEHTITVPNALLSKITKSIDIHIEHIPTVKGSKKLGMGLKSLTVSKVKI